MEFNATFIVSAISFLVFVFVMNAIFYKPLQKVVNERKEFVDGNYDEAKWNSDKSTALIKDRAERILKAGSEGKAHMLKKTNDVKAVKENMTQEARQKSLDEMNSAKDELNQAKTEAKDALKSHVVGLAQSISDKFLGERAEISSVDYDLIDKIMQESK
jgi:F-type H+-transporting ATPase subunit b